MKPHDLNVRTFAAVLFGLCAWPGAFAGVAQFSGGASDAVRIETWGTGASIEACGFELAGGGNATVDPTQPVSVVTGGVIPTVSDYGSMRLDLFEPISAVTVGSMVMEIQLDTPDFVKQAVIVAGLSHGAATLEVWDGDRVVKVIDLVQSVCCATVLQITLDTSSMMVDADSGSGMQQVFQLQWADAGNCYDEPGWCDVAPRARYCCASIKEMCRCIPRFRTVWWTRRRCPWKG